MSWRVLITARTLHEVGQDALRRLREAGVELVVPHRAGPLQAEELRRQLPGMDAVLAGMDPFTEAVLVSAEAAQLKLISRWGVGYDAIDVAAATRCGVVVAYTPGLLDETVADYAFALLLAVARRIHEGHLGLQQGVWQSRWGHDVFGKTLGLVGCGRIGQAVARRAAGFAMRVLAFDPAPAPAAAGPGIRFVSLEELLAASDFVSLHATLTPASRGLLGEPQLRRMKPTAYLINTARGALVDEGALARALGEGWIAGAALDVFTTEPLPAEHALRRAPNVLLAPHQASFARETGARVSLAAAEAVLALRAGDRPQHVVNPEVFQCRALRARLTGEGPSA